MGARGPGKYVLFEQQPVAQLLDGLVKFEAYHQSFAPHLLDLGYLAESVDEVLPHAGGIVDQVFVAHDVEHGAGGGTGQVVAAEGGPQHAVDRGELGADEDAADGKSVTHSLGYGDEVGAYAGILVGKELARAAVARLYLVEYEYDVVTAACLAQLLQELHFGYLNAAHALYALDDDGADVAGGHLLLDTSHVVEGEESHLEGVVDGGDDTGVVGHLDCGRGTAVEGVGKGDDLLLAGVERGQFQRVFVGLGPRVDEEEGIVVIPRQGAQLVGQLLLQAVDHRVGVEDEFFSLFGNSVHVVGVRMADGDDGVAAVQVEVFGPVGVVGVAPFSRYDFQIEQRIYIE